MLLLQIHHERRRPSHFLIGATIALHAGRYFYFMFIKMYHVLLFYYLCFTSTENGSPKFRFVSDNLFNYAAKVWCLQTQDFSSKYLCGF